MSFPTTEACIQAAEQTLGVVLPAAHRAHLRAKNGGEMRAARDVWQVFPVFDTSNRKTMTRSANHIVLETANAHQWTGFPENGVAIAANGTGDLLVLMPGDTVDRLDAQVFHWHHETGELTPVSSRYSA